MPCVVLSIVVLCSIFSSLVVAVSSLCSWLSSEGIVTISAIIASLIVVISFTPGRGWFVVRSVPFYAAFCVNYELLVVNDQVVENEFGILIIFTGTFEFWVQNFSLVVCFLAELFMYAYVCPFKESGVSTDHLSVLETGKFCHDGTRSTASRVISNAMDSFELNWMSYTHFCLDDVFYCLLCVFSGLLRYASKKQVVSHATTFKFADAAVCFVEHPAV